MCDKFVGKWAGSGGAGALRVFHLAAISNDSLTHKFVALTESIRLLTLKNWYVTNRGVILYVMNTTGRVSSFWGRGHSIPSWFHFYYPNNEKHYHWILG